MAVTKLDCCLLLAIAVVGVDSGLVENHGHTFTGDHERPESMVASGKGMGLLQVRRGGADSWPDKGDGSSSSASSKASSSSSASSESRYSVDTGPYHAKPNKDHGKKHKHSSKHSGGSVSNCETEKQQLDDFKQTYACNPPSNNVSALIVDSSGGLIRSGGDNPAFVNGTCGCESAQHKETFYNPLNFGGASTAIVCLNAGRDGVDFTNFCACSADDTCYKFKSAQEANKFIFSIAVVSLCSVDGSGCHAQSSLYCATNSTVAELAAVSGPGAVAGGQPVVNCATTPDGYQPADGQIAGVETLFISCNGCPTTPVTQQQCQGTFNSAA